MREKILIVDDDIYFAKDIEAFLKKDYEVWNVYTYNNFFEKFAPYFFDLVLLDLRLGEKEEDKEKGIELLKYIKENSPPTSVIILTAFADIDSAVRCLKLGASDYLRKENITEGFLKKTIINTLERDYLKRRLDNLEAQIQEESPWKLVGKSKAIQQVKEQIKMVAEDGEIDVLVTGESGTGKELVARNIHVLGKRKKAPFISLNLAVYPRDILYSQIFGHEKGAFTGAASRKIGSFEAAHKGIVFLDEIKEASSEIQISLLRFLESREFVRLGSNTPVKVDIQILFATNKDLRKEVERGEFRDDLFYRINRFEIHLPPLRDRKEDIEILIYYFLNTFRKAGRGRVQRIEKEVMDVFMKYSWPGNIRELRNVIEAAVIKADVAKVINLSHIPHHIIAFQALVKNSFEFKRKILEKEMEEIEQALQKANFRKIEAAKLIGYNRSHLTRKIKKIFKDNPDFKEKFPIITKLYFKA